MPPIVLAEEAVARVKPEMAMIECRDLPSVIDGIVSMDPEEQAKQLLLLFIEMASVYDACSQAQAALTDWIKEE